MDWTEAFMIAGELCDYLADQGLEMPTPAQQEHMAGLIYRRNGMKWSNHNQDWYTPKAVPAVLNPLRFGRAPGSEDRD